MPETEFATCECENASHFTSDTTVHCYGKSFPAQELQNVHTMFGIFRVCKKCAGSCLKDWPMHSALAQAPVAEGNPPRETLVATSQHLIHKDQIDDLETCVDIAMPSGESDAAITGTWESARDAILRLKEAFGASNCGKIAIYPVIE